MPGIKPKTHMESHSTRRPRNPQAKAPKGKPADFSSDLGIVKIYMMDSDRQARYDHEPNHRQKILRKAAAAIAPELNITSGGDLVEDLAREMGYVGITSYERWFGEEIEDGSIASQALTEVAKASRGLQEAILALGHGALQVLRMETVDPSLYALAEPGELPTPCVQGILEEGWEGAWVRRLKALEALATLKADRIKATVRKGGPKALAKHLVETDQVRVIRSCLYRLRKWGAEPALTLPMAQAIHQAMTGEKVSPQWGRKIFARLSQTPSK